MTGRMVLAAVLLAAASQAAQAQAVKVEFQMGKVNLVAKDASLRAILTEWARVGGTRLVNPERLTGGPLTLELVGVPERQALDILLRDVGGYILGPRPTLVMGVSAVDRLVVVTATAGRGVQPGPAFPAPRPQQIGRVVQPPPIDDDDIEESLEAEGPERDEPPVRGRQGGPVLNPGLPPLPRALEPAPEARPATPGNPFGAVQGSARPGAIAPVPEPPPTQQASPSQTQPPPN
jgi:hypothetical protein